MNQPIPAQQRDNISYEVSGENSKYTLLQSLDVADMPGYSLTLYELRRTFPKDPPMFAGVHLKDQWVRGTTDTVDGNGSVIGYAVYNLENGDKIFGRFDGISQVATGQSSNKRAVTGSIVLTGGTGKMRGIRGTIHVLTDTDLSVSLNVTKCEGEYWMENE